MAVGSSCLRSVWSRSLRVAARAANYKQRERFGHRIKMGGGGVFKTELFSIRRCCPMQRLIMTATSFEWDPLHPIFLVLVSRACRSQRQDHSHDCQCLRSGTHRLAGSFNFAMTPMTRKLTLAFVVFPLAPLNHHSTFKQLPYPFQFGSFCLFSRQALRKETSTQSPEADLTDHQGIRFGGSAA